MQARLVCQTDCSAAAGDVSLGEFLFPVVLGRGAVADVQLNDRWVSRRHCEIDCLFGRLVVRDLDSRHGTMVNGEPVRERILNADDVLTVGMTTFRVEAPAHESSGRLETAGAV